MFKDRICPFTAHGRLYALCKKLAVTDRALRATDAIVGQGIAKLGLTVVPCLFQGAQYEVGPHRAAHAPHHDPPGRDTTPAGCQSILGHQQEVDLPDLLAQLLAPRVRLLVVSAPDYSGRRRAPRYRKTFTHRCDNAAFAWPAHALDAEKWVSCTKLCNQRCAESPGKCRASRRHPGTSVSASQCAASSDEIIADCASFVGFLL